MDLILHLLVTTLLILLVEKAVKGIDVDGWTPALIAAVVIGIVNTIVRPILVILTFPITLLTLGLFLLVINALMFMLTAALVPGFRVAGFLPALYGSILLSLLGLVMSVFL